MCVGMVCRWLLCSRSKLVLSLNPRHDAAYSDVLSEKETPYKGQ